VSKKSSLFWLLQSINHVLMVWGEEKEGLE